MFDRWSMLITRAFLHLFTHLLFLFIGYLLAKEFQRHQDQHQLMRQNDSRHRKVTATPDRIKMFCLEEDKRSYKERNLKEFCFYFCSSNNSSSIVTYSCSNHAESKNALNKNSFPNPNKLEDYSGGVNFPPTSCENEPVAPQRLEKDFSLLNSIVKYKVPFPFVTSRENLWRTYIKELHRPQKVPVTIKAFVKKYFRTDEILVSLANKRLISYLRKSYTCVCYKSFEQLFLEESDFKHKFSQIIFLYLKELKSCEDSHSTKISSNNIQVMVIKKCKNLTNVGRKRVKAEIYPKHSFLKLSGDFSDNVNIKSVNKNQKESKLIFRKLDMNAGLKGEVSYSERISNKLRHSIRKQGKLLKQPKVNRLSNKVKRCEKSSKNISKLKQFLSMFPGMKRRQTVDHTKQKPIVTEMENTKLPKRNFYSLINFPASGTSSLTSKDFQESSVSNVSIKPSEFSKRIPILKYYVPFNYNSKNILHKRSFGTKIPDIYTYYRLRKNNRFLRRKKSQQNKTASPLTQNLLLRNVRNVSTPRAKTNASILVDFSLTPKRLFQEKTDKSSNFELNSKINVENVGIMEDSPTSMKSYDSSNIYENSGENQKTYSQDLPKIPVGSELENEFDNSDFQSETSDKFLEHANTDNTFKNINDFMHPLHTDSEMEDVSKQSINLSVEKEYSSDKPAYIDVYNNDKNTENAIDDISVNSFSNAENVQFDSQYPTDLSFYDKRDQNIISTKSEEIFLTEEKLPTADNKNNDFTTNDLEFSTYMQLLTSGETRGKSTIQSLFPSETGSKSFTEEDFENTESNFDKQANKPSVTEPKFPHEMSDTSGSLDKTLGVEYWTGRNDDLKTNLNLGTITDEPQIPSENPDATSERFDKNLGDEFWTKSDNKDLIPSPDLGTITNEPRISSENSYATSERFDKNLGDDYWTGRNDDLMNDSNFGTITNEPQIPSEKPDATSGRFDKNLGDEFWTKSDDEDLIQSSDSETIINEPRVPSENSYATSERFDGNLGDEFWTKSDDKDLIQSSDSGRIINEPRVPPENSYATSERFDENLGDEFWTKSDDKDLIQSSDSGTIINEPRVPSENSYATGERFGENLGDEFWTKSDDKDLIHSSDLGIIVNEPRIPSENSYATSERFDENLGDEFWTKRNDNDFTHSSVLGTQSNTPTIVGPKLPSETLDVTSVRSDNTLREEYRTEKNNDLIISLNSRTSFTDFTSANDEYSTVVKTDDDSKISNDEPLALDEEISGTENRISTVSNFPQEGFSESKEFISLKTDYSEEPFSEDGIFGDLSSTIKFSITTFSDLQSATKQSKNAGASSVRTERDVSINTDTFNLDEHNIASEINVDFQGSSLDTEESEFIDEKITESEIKTSPQGSESDKIIPESIEALTGMQNTLATKEFTSLIPEKNTDFSETKDDQVSSVKSDKTSKDVLSKFDDDNDFSGQTIFTIKNDFSSLFSSTKESAASKSFLGDPDMSIKTDLVPSFPKDDSYFETDLIISTDDSLSRKDLTESMDIDLTLKINGESDKPSTENLSPASIPTFPLDSTIESRSFDQSESVAVTAELYEATSDEMILTSDSGFTSENIKSIEDEIVSEKIETSKSEKESITEKQITLTSDSIDASVDSLNKISSSDDSIYPITKAVTFTDLISAETFPMVNSITSIKNELTQKVSTDNIPKFDSTPEDNTGVKIVNTLDGDDITTFGMELDFPTEVNTINEKKFTVDTDILQTDAFVSSEISSNENVDFKEQISTTNDEDLTEYNTDILLTSDDNIFISNTEIIYTTENKVSENTPKDFPSQNKTDLSVPNLTNEATESFNNMASMKEYEDVFSSREISTEYLSDFTPKSLTNSATTPTENAASSPNENEISLQDEESMKRSDNEILTYTEEVYSPNTDSISLQVEEITNPLTEDLTTKLIKEVLLPQEKTISTQEDKDIDSSSEEILIRTDRDVFSSSGKDMSVSNEEMPSSNNDYGLLIPNDGEISLSDKQDEDLIPTGKEVVTYDEGKESSPDAFFVDESGISDYGEETTYPVNEIIRTEREIIPSNLDPESFQDTSDENVNINIANIAPDSGSELDSGITSIDPGVASLDGTSELSLSGETGVDVNVNVDISTELNLKTSSKDVPLNTDSDISTEVNVNEESTLPELFLSPAVPSVDETNEDPGNEKESSSQQSVSITVTSEKTSTNDVKSSENVSPSTYISQTSESTADETTMTSSTTRSTTTSTTTSTAATKTSATTVSSSRPTETPSTFRVETTSSSSGRITASSSEAPSIPFHFTIDADYDELVGKRKKEFEESLTKQLVVVMRIPSECLQNLKVSKGSIEVNFDLAPNSAHGHMADEKALKAAADELKRMIDNGQLNLNDLNGNTMIIVPMDPPTKAPVVNQTEHTTVILGVVIGAFIITVISVAVAAIIIKRKASGTQRLSPIEEARSKLPSYREIPFQEALFVKGNKHNKLMLGKYCYNTGKWLGPGPEPVPYHPPDSVVYRPPTDSEIRQTPRPPTAVRERLKNDWELDWDSMVFSR